MSNVRQLRPSNAQNTTMKTLARVAAVLAFLLCLVGGLWILFHVGPSKDDAVWTGIGLYFVGKAFFVGPILLVAAEQLGRGAEGK
jgi:hypothetical protein